jgi:hypothetical protein
MKNVHALHPFLAADILALLIDWITSDDVPTPFSSPLSIEWGNSSP